jgi:predicted nucleotidyltransferase
MRFWSVSTTVRNPDRVRTFLKVLNELEGETWNKETQRRYQILLLQKKAYGINVPEFEKTLSSEHRTWLHSDNFTYEQAEKILDAKNYKGGEEMRGRQSFNPLEKMGLARIDSEKKIKITSFGKSFLADDYDLGDIFCFAKNRAIRSDLFYRRSKRISASIPCTFAVRHIKTKKITR